MAFSDITPPVETLSTASLAYLGDSVIEVYVRRRLVCAGLSSAKRLNEASLTFVRAGAQARAMETILPLLTEEENAVFRRGRNSGHANVPKNATVAEYRHATGMEALFGWLYLKNDTERIAFLLNNAWGDSLTAAGKLEK